MAVYKVAQDVEADDKLIGPFSFRQFVYLIIVAMAGALAWGLSQLFIGLAIIPLPIILFFGALALPLRKDQPMEVYLAAIVSFYLKPRRRLWSPDGIESLVHITAPKVVEVQRTKELSQDEATQRLSYLADIADTGGWAIRHASAPNMDSPMNSTAFLEAQQTEDVLDAQGGVARSFDDMINQADQRRRQEAVDRMHTPAPASASATPTSAPAASAAPQSSLDTAYAPTQSYAPPQVPTAPVSDPRVSFNPYPTNIHQSVVQPLDPNDQLAGQEPEVNQAPSTSEKQVSPDIINLANNPDLSIETIQQQADRIQKKNDDDQEVVISLH